MRGTNPGFISKNIRFRFIRKAIVSICIIVLTIFVGQKAVGIVLAGGGDYYLPWPKCSTKVATQGYVKKGNISHLTGTKMEYALDFDLDEGDLIAAVRGGKASYIKDDIDSDVCGNDSFVSKANYVVIDHGDGTSALYLHLDEVFVDLDDPKVSQGEVIGTAGKTGWTYCTPHLHFQLQKTGNSYWQQSIPITFDEVDGGDLNYGKDVHSENVTPDDGDIASGEKDARPEIAANTEECSHLQASGGNVICKVADESFLVIELDYIGFKSRETYLVTDEYPCNQDTALTDSDGEKFQANENGHAYWSFRKDYLNHCGTGWYTHTLRGNSSGSVAWIRFYWDQ